MIDNDGPRPAARRPVEKATAILAELAAAATPLTLSELTRRTGLPRSTTHRLLVAITDDGLVRHCGTGYRLNEAVSWLAAPIDVRIIRLRRLRRWLLPHLIDLYEVTHQTINLAVLQGNDVVYVERVHGHNRVASRSDVSDSAPAYRTAAGKVLLAFQPGHRPALPHGPHRVQAARGDLEAELTGIRSDGVAFSFADLTPQVHCAAAPVRDRAGQTIAAVAVAGRAPDFDPRNAVPSLRRTGHALSMTVRRFTAPESGGPPAHLPSPRPPSTGISAAVM